MGQTWERQLFAHWPVPAGALERVMPPQLAPERFDGDAWLGITPFRLSNLRLRGTPPVPRLSRFPELNVRTYVRVEDKPGIYFLSLDAASRLAVLAARRFYRLPYFKARMSIEERRDQVSYRARRTSEDGPAASFEASYRPTGEADPAPAGALDHWLIERYCLYTLDERGSVWRGEIHHPPWPLQSAEAELINNTMAEAFAISLRADPLLHFAARQDVAIWRIREVGGD